MLPTFLFYDLETFGIDPQLDRIAQFACIRTDASLEEIEEPLTIYCKISPDYLPDIDACLLTGITPQLTLEKGLCEHDFIQQINEVFLVPNTCVLGYNNIRFDDEFVRNALYRNFLDPYRREWAEGNSRWDLIDMVRLTHDLRPGNIVWPLNAESKPSFKLEDLAKANNLTNGKSHDALADVRNTISMARLIRESAPKLFEYCYNHRDKHAISRIVLKEKEILVHTSRMLESDYGCTSLIVPLMAHPSRANYVISYDLRYDPENLINLPIEELEKLIFVKKNEPNYSNRVHLKGIHLNKCPILAPLSVLDTESIGRLHLSRDLCQTHYEKLLQAKEEITKKLLLIYSKEPAYEKDSADPDTQIYSGGFFSDSDRNQFALIHKAKPETLSTLSLKAKDKRVPEMFFRWQGRNYPETFSEAELQQWKEFSHKNREAVLSKRNQTMESYKQQLQNLEKKDIAENLAEWCEALIVRRET